jgi:glycosyltransferase involved in cell wall biosynthesis
MIQIGMEPLFSIILPTYNRCNFLPRAISSVLQQTYPHYELIIIDDGSTDDTPAVLAALADPRIITIKQAKNQGVSTARNTGLLSAKGQYICFLDDDDEYFPDYLQEIYQFLAQHNLNFVGFIWTGIASVYSANNISNEKEMTRLEHWDLKKEKNLLYLTRVAFYGITFNRICFERVGLFNPKLHFGEDIDILFRILEAGMDHAAIPKILIKIHIHERSSLSRSLTKRDKIKAMEYFLFTHDKFLSKHLQLWSYFYCSLAGDYYRIGKKHLARRLIFSILKKCWYYPRTWEVFLRFEFKLLTGQTIK